MVACQVIARHRYKTIYINYNPLISCWVYVGFVNRVKNCPAYMLRVGYGLSQGIGQKPDP